MRFVIGVNRVIHPLQLVLILRVPFILGTGVWCHHSFSSSENWICWLHHVVRTCHDQNDACGTSTWRQTWAGPVAALEAGWNGMRDHISGGSQSGFWFVWTCACLHFVSSYTNDVKIWFPIETSVHISWISISCVPCMVSIFFLVRMACDPGRIPGTS